MLSSLKELDVTDTNQINNDSQQELKLAYLNILQNIISRMSNNVMIMKTTNVTILTAMLTFSATETVTNFDWWMFLIPWALFTFYHAYFLHKESIFISLYNKSLSKSNFNFNDFKIDMSEIDKLNLNDIFNYNIKFSFFVFQFGLIFIVLISFIFGVKNV